MSQSVETVSLDELLSAEPDRNVYEGLRKVIHASRANYRMAEKRAGELKQSLGEKGKNDKTAMTLGALLSAMGLYKEAFDALSTLRANTDVRYFSGLALVRLGRYEEAVKTLSESAAGDRDAHMLLAETYIIMGRCDEANKVMKEADLGSEDTADGCYLLGRLAEAAGEYERAIELFQKAVQLNPEHLSALFRMAYNFDLNGQDDLAMEAYEKCTKLVPTDLGALLNLGTLYEDHELYYEAADCYKRVLASDPGNTRARNFLRDAQSSLTMWVDEEELKKIKLEDEVLKIPVSDFELSVRSRNCLERMGISTLGDLTRVGEQELLSFKNFGETSLNEIRQMLTIKGLRLGQGLEERDEGKPKGQKARREMEEKLLTPVSSFNLSTRCRRCMERLNVRTVGDLVKYAEEELLAIPNFGKTSVSELKTRLGELGLELKQKKKQGVL